MNCINTYRVITITAPLLKLFLFKKKKLYIVEISTKIGTMSFSFNLLQKKKKKN